MLLSPLKCATGVIHKHAYAWVPQRSHKYSERSYYYNYLLYSLTLVEKKSVIRWFSNEKILSYSNTFSNKLNDIPDGLKTEDTSTDIILIFQLIKLPTHLKQKKKKTKMRYKNDK